MTGERDIIRAEYEAEFVDSAPKTEGVPDVQALAKLLGPSPRAIVKQIEVTFGKKIHELENEVTEMYARETSLKETIRRQQDTNAKLALERDEWRAKSDPTQEILHLRNELAQSKALHEGWQKMVKEHKDKADALQVRILNGEKRRKELVVELEAVKQENEAIKPWSDRYFPRVDEGAAKKPWWRFW